MNLPPAARRRTRSANAPPDFANWLAPRLANSQRMRCGREPKADAGGGGGRGQGAAGERQRMRCGSRRTARARTLCGCVDANVLAHGVDAVFPEAAHNVTSWVVAVRRRRCAKLRPTLAADFAGVTLRTDWPLLGEEATITTSARNPQATR